MSVKLTDLVGEHVLTGVQQGEYRRKNDYTDEDAAVFLFVLDGVTYRATEDPEDGYRSSMDEITIAPAETVSNLFAPVRVVCSHRTRGTYSGEDDVLEIRDAANGAVIAEVGTENVDDYYPGFVGAFFPDRMSVNAPAEQPEIPK